MNQSLKKLIKFIFKKKNKLSPVYSHNTWSLCYNYYYLNSLFKWQSYFLFIYRLIKDFFALGINNISFYGNLRNDRNIIINWANINHFDSLGNFNDGIFGLNSVNLKFSWLLIYRDTYVPTIIPDNVVLLHIKKKTFSILELIKNSRFLFLDNLISYKLNKFFEKKIHHKFDYKVLMPYEAQFFQKNFINYFRLRYKKLNFIGYHSALPPLPINLIYDKNSPDKIICSGNDQRYYLTKVLKWPKKKVINCSSFRYQKNNNKLIDTIFLPYDIFDYGLIINAYKLLINSYNFELKNFKVSIHPHKVNSNVHNKLKAEILKINSNTSDKKNKNYLSNSIIVIGPTTVVIEALIKKINVFHICSNILYEKYDNFFWPSIFSEEICKNTFIYKVEKPENILNISSKRNVIENYI